jgi:hypothetical protein
MEERTSLRVVATLKNVLLLDSCGCWRLRDLAGIACHEAILCATKALTRRYHAVMIVAD